MPISADSQYCLDSAVELCQITVDNADFFYRTGYDLDSALDELSTPGLTYMTEEFRKIYRSGYRKLPKMDRGSLNLSFLLGSSMQFREIETNVATDLVEGKSDEEALQKFDSFFAVVREGFERCRDDLFRIPVRSLIDYETERRYRLQIDRDNRRSRVQTEILEQELGYPVRKVNREMIKKGRSVVKKSLRTLERLAGSETARLFVRGEEVIVQGQEFSFRFQKNPDFDTVLSSATPEHRRHISFKLDLLTVTGDYLATGCVYMPDTPVLDQVTGLLLHVRSGNEAEIVKVTNWFDCSPDFMRYEPLQVIREQKAAELRSRFRDKVPDEIIIPEATEPFREGFLNELLLPIFCGGRVSEEARIARQEFCRRRDELKPRAARLIKGRLYLPDNFTELLMTSTLMADELQLLDCDNRVQALVTESMEKMND